MQLQRGIQLGQLHQTLGIRQDARIAFHLTATGVTIWDFDAGIQYIVSPNGVQNARFEVPQRMKEIFKASDEVLKRRFDEGWLEGWNDERETIFTELCLRGVNMLPGH